MKNTSTLRKRALMLTVCALVLAVASVALRTVNFFFFFDAEIGYHTAGALLPIAVNVLLALSVAFCFLWSILRFRKQTLGYSKRVSPALSVAAILASAGFLVRTILVFMNRTEGDKLALISLLTGALGTVYFILTAFRVKNEPFRILTGFCAILNLVVALADSYFNIFIQMNAPDKLMFQLGCIGGMIFLVCELRALIGYTRPVLYMAVGGSALVLLGAASLPSIIAYHAGLLADADMLAGYYLLLGLFLYVAVRLICVSLNPTPEEEPVEMAAEAPAESEDTEDISAEEPTSESDGQSEDADREATEGDDFDQKATACDDSDREADEKEDAGQNTEQ